MCEGEELLVSAVFACVCVLVVFCCVGDVGLGEELLLLGLVVCAFWLIGVSDGVEAMLL